VISRCAKKQNPLFLGASSAHGRAVTSILHSIWRYCARLVPGTLLCVAIGVAGILLQRAETGWFGRAWLEALVLAILLGAVMRTIWTPGLLWREGIEFSARTLLEIAVALLGATISAGAVIGAGLSLFAAILGAVAVTIFVSYAVGRLLGLSQRMATLVACGNSICGNSAIAAVAPVIGADGGEVACSIAFTAVLGVAVVIGLPFLAGALHMTAHGYGIFAGLTVYAVPQVLAATAPISSASAQIGTLVKLVRVLMLGPVVLVLSLLVRAGHIAPSPQCAGRARDVARKPGLFQFVPWFIVVFLALIAAHSANLLPERALASSGAVAGGLTIVSMAALGLGVDIRAVARAGARVTLAVTLSLLFLGCVAFGLIAALHLG
jgi:uncharacterized integral membrane protein (TIGR00698 family)